jgi:hypothetical protein
MSTIGVTQTLGIRDHLAARKPGAVFVDAPVPGSKDPADRGQLLILASGHSTAEPPIRTADPARVSHGMSAPSATRQSRPWFDGQLLGLYVHASPSFG